MTVICRSLVIAMRVLIADDTMFMRTLLMSWVESMGYVALAAADGAEAVTIAERDGFDIAIIDWEMPKLSGMEVIGALRANPRTAYAHIILITGGDEQDRLVQALEGGADDFVRKPIYPPALMARLRAGARIVTMRQEILKLATVDPLTGAANRRHFFERASEHLAMNRRRLTPLSVLAADIDHFKAINDGRGHAGGDAALQRFAETCRAELRPMDLLGRLGGEEFAVLLPDTSASGALAVAERLRAAVAALASDAGGPMTVSIGVAEVPAGAETIDPALAAADGALYRAKARGRNRVERAE